MTRPVTFNPKRDTPYLAAISQAVLYVWAGATLLGFWGWIPGLFMGALVSVTMAYASSQYEEVARARKKYVMAGMIILGLFSPVVIGTSMYLDLPAAIHPIWRGVVGAVLGIIPDVSVFLTGFVAGKGLVAKDKQDQSEPKQTKPAKEPNKPAFICSCGYEAKTQAGLNGHQRKHSKISGKVK